MTVFTPVYYAGDHRVEYFKKYINSVMMIDDISNINFLFIAEPNSNKLLDLIPKNLNYTIINNEFRRGLLNNVFFGIEYVFNMLNEDYVIYFEEDVVFSKDIFNITNYYISLGDKNSILCYLNKHKMFLPNHDLYKEENPNGIISVNCSTYYAPWGSCFSKKFWNETWKPLIKLYPDVGFDCLIDVYVQQVNIYTPCISRLNTIGKSGSGYNELIYSQHGFEYVKLYDGIKNSFNIIKA